MRASIGTGCVTPLQLSGREMRKESKQFTFLFLQILFYSLYFFQILFFLYFFQILFVFLVLFFFKGVWRRKAAAGARRERLETNFWRPLVSKIQHFNVLLLSCEIVNRQYTSNIQSYRVQPNLGMTNRPTRNIAENAKVKSLSQSLAPPTAPDCTAHSNSTLYQRWKSV